MCRWMLGNLLTAEDGMAGLEVISQNGHIEVVISDMKMPHMNGIEFIRRAKEIDRALTGSMR